MVKLLYATSNSDKFAKAQTYLRPFDIEVIQHALELPELQSFEGEEIVRQKAQHAFSVLKQPVLACDDSWAIPALRGFPATNMKQCNHFLVPEDWLRLMSGIEDRRIFLQSYLALAWGEHATDTRVFSYTQESYFLNQKQGEHHKSPHLTVIAWKGETRSIAECIADGYSPEEKLHEFWKNLADSIFDIVHTDHIK